MYCDLDPLSEALVVAKVEEPFDPVDVTVDAAVLLTVYEEPGREVSEGLASVLDGFSCCWVAEGCDSV